MRENPQCYEIIPSDQKDGCLTAQKEVCKTCGQMPEKTLDGDCFCLSCGWYE